MGLIDRFRRRGDAPPAGADAAPPVADDGFGDGDVRVVGPTSRGPATESSTGSATGSTASVGGSVLDELSDAFSGDADDESPDGAELTSRVPVTTPRRAAAQTEAVARTSAAPTAITIGGVDDVPDAVYLDDALADTDVDDESTVFIDDDGRGDAILPQDATGPGIEPRLRQRRIGVRRAEGRRRLLWILVAVVVLAVVVAGVAVLGSSLFAVQNVRISGQRYADEQAVAEVVDDLRDTPTLLVDVDDAERRLEEIAWVDRARVRPDFPNSVSVELREREPLSAVQGVDRRFRILDREGRVLAIEDGRPIAPVLISGPQPLDLEVGAFAPVGYAAASTLVSKLSADVRSRLVSMTAAPDGSDIRLVLSNTLITGEPAPDIEVRLGAALGDNEQLERLVRLERILDDVDGGDTTVIDVSTEEATAR